MPKKIKKRQGSSRRELLSSTEELLLDHAYHDSLTGLPNRILFDYRLRETLVRAREQGALTAVLTVDVDRLKNTNHIYDYRIGDALLEQMAQRLRCCVGPQTLLARLGGDEFLIALTVSEVQQATQMVHQILEAIRPPFSFDGDEHYVTVSVGVSLYPLDGDTAETLLRNAETALERVKKDGKNNFQFYTAAMSSNAIRRLTLESSLRRALKHQEFVLHYQPQVDLRSGKIVGVEALIRWEVPGYGLVPPVEFIPIAEEAGLIVPMGEWVLRTACTQHCAWRQMGLPILSVAVNLSARQFHEQDLAKTIGQVIRSVGMEARFLELEITESYAMQNADYTISVLRDLKEKGIRLSIDDFGTGYSSLSYLKQFPIDALKIDRSFVKDLSADPHDAAIASAIIVLAHNLGLEVVAEGVETLEQLAILRKQQCDRMQGYLFSRPVPAAELEAMVRAGKWLPGKSIDSALAREK
ncbi:MAG: EAL domain-containing protein [Elusimicrobiota bacterium]